MGKALQSLINKRYKIMHANALNKGLKINRTRTYVFVVLFSKQTLISINQWFLFYPHFCSKFEITIRTKVPIAIGALIQIHLPRSIFCISPRSLSSFYLRSNQFPIRKGPNQNIINESRMYRRGISTQYLRFRPPHKDDDQFNRYLNGF